MLWDIETGTCIREFVGHNYAVWSLDLSPDSRTVVSGSADNTVILWNFATGNIIRRFEGHLGWVFDVAFHPNGNSVFSASGDGTLRQWRIGDWSYEEVLVWIRENRNVRELTCDEREIYRIEPACETDNP